MADRTSAYLFGTLFEIAASGEQLTGEKLWELMVEGNYDFSECQMGVEDALTKLGLAWECQNPECEDRWEDRGMTNYGPRKGKRASTKCYTCNAPRPE